MWIRLHGTIKTIQCSPLLVHFGVLLLSRPVEQMAVSISSHRGNCLRHTDSYILWHCEEAGILLCVLQFLVWWPFFPNASLCFPNSAWHRCWRSSQPLSCCVRVCILFCKVCVLVCAFYQAAKVLSSALYTVPST